MSRMIDADNLIELIDKEYPTIDRQDMKMMVAKAPTAYDVDEVVDKIQREKCPDIFCLQQFNNALDVAIDIVKRGGVDK